MASTGAFSCSHRFETKSVLSCGLIMLTFELSTSKLGHASPVYNKASFLPILSFLCPSFHSRRIGPGAGDNRQTDRRTDNASISPLCPTLWGGPAEHNNVQEGADAMLPS